MSPDLPDLRERERRRGPLLCQVGHGSSRHARADRTADGAQHRATDSGGCGVYGLLGTLRRPDPGQLHRVDHLRCLHRAEPHWRWYRYSDGGQPADPLGSRPVLLASRSPVFVYNTTKFTGSELVLTYPETTVRYLRLVIHDEESPALSVQGVDVWGFQRRLVFSATSQQSCKLYYGNSEARRPSYDIEQVFPYLVTERLAQVELGSQVNNPGFVERQPPFTERFLWLLPTVIILAGVVLAALLFGILR